MSCLIDSVSKPFSFMCSVGAVPRPAPLSCCLWIVAQEFCELRIKPTLLCPFIIKKENKHSPTQGDNDEPSSWVLWISHIKLEGFFFFLLSLLLWPIRVTLSVKGPITEASVHTVFFYWKASISRRWLLHHHHITRQLVAMLPQASIYQSQWTTYFATLPHSLQQQQQQQLSTAVLTPVYNHHPLLKHLWAKGTFPATVLAITLPLCARDVGSIKMILVQQLSHKQPRKSQRISALQSQAHDDVKLIKTIYITCTIIWCTYMGSVHLNNLWINIWHINALNLQLELLTNVFFLCWGNFCTMWHYSLGFAWILKCLVTIWPWDAALCKMFLWRSFSACTCEFSPHHKSYNLQPMGVYVTLKSDKSILKALVGNDFLCNISMRVLQSRPRCCKMMIGYVHYLMSFSHSF